MEPTTDSRPPATPTPATAWDTGGLYRLPSGNVARLVRPSLVALAAAGPIPNPLSRAVLKFLAVEGDGKPSEQQQIDRYIEHTRVFQEVAARCLIAPRLILDRAPDPVAGEIGPDMLADADYSWIYYAFVEGRADDTATFRVG